MTLVIEPTKTSAGTRKLPITEDVAKCFQAIIEDREKPKVEKVVDGYTGFLFLDDKGLPLVAMHWEHRFNSMVNRYNQIYRVQILSTRITSEHNSLLLFSLEFAKLTLTYVVCVINFRMRKKIQVIILIITQPFV